MKKETNAFIMVDKRVAQFPKTLKPIDRLVYFTMLDGADYYESKFGRYAPSIDYLMVMSVLHVIQLLIHLRDLSHTDLSKRPM